MIKNVAKKMYRGLSEIDVEAEEKPSYLKKFDLSMFSTTERKQIYAELAEICEKELDLPCYIVSLKMAGTEPRKETVASIINKRLEKDYGLHDESFDLLHGYRDLIKVTGSKLLEYWWERQWAADYGSDLLKAIDIKTPLDAEEKDVITEIGGLMLTVADELDYYPDAKDGKIIAIAYKLGGAEQHDAERFSHLLNEALSIRGGAGSRLWNEVIYAYKTGEACKEFFAKQIAKVPSGEKDIKKRLGILSGKLRRKNKPSKMDMFIGKNTELLVDR